MLYISTRNIHDTVTANHPLKHNRSPEGGYFRPLQFPAFSPDDLKQLFKKRFGEITADLLNALLPVHFSGWDVDFSVGRYPVRVMPMAHKVYLAEVWHNPDWSYERLVNNLLTLLEPDESTPTTWFRTAVRIAVLFAIFGELKMEEGQRIDVAVVSGDFSLPVSAYYARKMGLPVGNIVCCCNENNSLWELLCHGLLRTDAVSIPTRMPEADFAIPDALECLLFEAGGCKEVYHYLESCCQGKNYIPDEAVLQDIQSGIYASVIGSNRIMAAIPNVYHSHKHLISSYTALTYSGLQDYRAKTGATSPALILSEKSPIQDLKNVTYALGVSESDILQKMTG